MKVNILNAKKEQTGTIDLPEQFQEVVRPDLVRRAVLSIEANSRQAYGTAPEAGQRHSVYVSKRRRNYKTTYGLGVSRTPRKVMSRSGTRFGWMGANVPFAVGGRVAHPPKSMKLWGQKVNKKERRKAIRSAMAASLQPQWIAKRGHKVPAGFPFVIDTEFESFKKTKDFVTALTTLGFGDELVRSSKKKIRAGAAARRGRKYKKTVGPLIVVSKSCDAQKAARNIPGVQVITVAKLNAKLLAPGCAAGRLTLYTQSAIEALRKEKLFM